MELAAEKGAAGTTARAAAVVRANQRATQAAGLGAKKKAERERAQEVATRAAAWSDRANVTATVAVNRRRLKRMAARLAEFSKARAGARAGRTWATRASYAWLYGRGASKGTATTDSGSTGRIAASVAACLCADTPASP